MEKITGVIDSIYTKDITIKNGPRAGQTSKVFHAIIMGQDINLGFQTSLVEGQNVTLDVEDGRFGKQLVSNTKGKANGSAAPTSRVQPARQTGQFPIDPTTKDMSIVRQSSLNRAVEVTKHLADLGLFKPKSANAYVERVYEIAYGFTDFGTGQREVKAAKALEEE